MFHQAILENGFEVSSPDHYIYICKNNDKLIILPLYVNDIMLTGNYLDMIKHLNLYMGVVNYVLGIKSLKIENQNYYTWIRKNIWKRYLKSLTCLIVNL
jgi:hypothetical protein